MIGGERGGSRLVGHAPCSKAADVDAIDRQADLGVGRRQTGRRGRILSSRSIEVIERYDSVIVIEEIVNGTFDASVQPLVCFSGGLR